MAAPCPRFCAYLIPVTSHKLIAVACRRLHGWYVRSTFWQFCPEALILIIVELILIPSYTALGVMYIFNASIL